MGVDRVRVSVVWSLLAPNATANRKPKFDATNPAAYPAGAWARYDFIDLVAHKLGIGVYFQPTAPAPNWATTPVPNHQGFRFANNINGTLYGQFVQAVGKRYSGHYLAANPIRGNKVAALPGDPLLGRLQRAQHRRLDDPAVAQGPRSARRGLAR